MNTRKRILFVDDESAVLHSLQRTFRSMRSEWDMTFVDSGAKALAFLSGSSVDVIVSDMRMPDMNGAELLESVMRLHPRTIRLILSGYADRDLVMRCVPVTHQFLAKPCDPEQLKAVICRTLALDGSMRNEMLQQIVSRMERLPSMPSLYCELVQMLQRPNTNVVNIADLIARDIAMTAKVLKLVNSAFFGLGHRVSSTREAVEYLGLETIKGLVLVVHLFSEYTGRRLFGPNPLSLWSHSQRTAGLAKQIMVALDAPQTRAEEAFVAAMLHDVGKLVLWDNLPEKCDAVIKACREEKLPVCQAELQLLGATHAEVGAYLMGLWGLPGPVVDTIRFHHNPTQSHTQGHQALAAVHIANGLVHQHTVEPPGSGTPDLDAAYVESLGLATRIPSWEDLLRDPVRLAET